MKLDIRQEFRVLVRKVTVCENSTLKWWDIDRVVAVAGELLTCPYTLDNDSPVLVTVLGFSRERTKGHAPTIENR